MTLREPGTETSCLEGILAGIRLMRKMFINSSAQRVACDRFAASLVSRSIVHVWDANFNPTAGVRPIVE